MTDAFLRIALAIVLDTAAFVIWDVGTRPPLRLIAEVGAGLRNRHAVLGGSARFIVGLALLILAEIVITPLAIRVGGTIFLEPGTLLVALLAEQLVGTDVRGRRRAGGSTR